MTVLSAPRRTAATDEVVHLTAADGHPLSLIHPQRDEPPTRGPVLLMHGAGVRANIFRAPVARTVVDTLLDAGYDVWLGNWRASVDLPPTNWTLDAAAVFDHPVLVREVLNRTGRDTCQAVIHCQGSTSFLMAATAGLLPEVTTIISNAVALHPVVPAWSRLKISRLAPVVARITAGVDPQWGRRAPTLFDKALRTSVLAVHRECSNPVCRMVSFTYGAGFPALWRHQNLNPQTHDWLSEEFGRVPMTFFAQMARCVARGHLVSVDGHPDLPASFVAQPPRTNARIVLLRGMDNLCFLPASMQHTYDFLELHRPGRNALHSFPGYSHLDVFMGERAAEDIFPTILQELEP